TLERIAKESAEEVERKRKFSGAGEPITLTMANRLFGQKGYEFRSEFLALTRELYNAPFEALEFCRNSVDAVRHINTWVEEETRQRIRNLISERALDEYTRLVLVNAIYLKAPWAQEFPTDSTTRLPFHLGTGKTLDMPTMVNQCLIGYRKYVGFKVVGIPYRAWELQF